MKQNLNEEITYTEKDGILYPNLRLPDMVQKPFGKYGHMRLEYLKAHRRGTYTTILTEGKLNEHLCQVDTEARNMVKLICAELAQQNGIDEDLKSRDPIKWVREMNDIKAGAEEIVLCEVVYNEASEYCIRGGHRTSEVLSVGRTKRIRLYEFDTTLWDSPHRYGGSFELYFKYIIPLLWSIYDDIPIEGSDIPNEFISYIPTLENLGVICHTDGKLCVDIPVLTKAEYDTLRTVIKNATDEMKTMIGNAFSELITSMKTPIPKHLTSVPELFRYHEATKYFVMSIVREAYEKGLHLKGVDYCCPPMALVYEE